MNALTVLSLAAVAACSNAQILGYPGIYGAYPGFYSGLLPQGYKGLLPAAAPLPVAQVPLTYSGVDPVSYNAFPYTPVAPIQTQHHAQDQLGQYSFGYAGGPSARSETRDAFGVVRGSYNYVDSQGKVQTQHYVADALGFRVSGTNLPEAPAAPEPASLAAPTPVEDTPEVTAAKAAHEAAHREAAAPAAITPARTRRSIMATRHVSAISPLCFSYGFTSPMTYSHPAVVGSPLQYTTALGAIPALTPYDTSAGFPTLTAYSPGQ
ncbi:cuticle protein 16.8-like [Palaemon carinicauda]|uniref:cuticle protein 16.8-like n=1 Tax=Palaemon carinicauda TaxID=392227 RepID=UPI0035B68BFA